MSGRKRGEQYWTPQRHNVLPNQRDGDLTNTELGLLVRLKTLCVGNGLLLDGSRPYTAAMIAVRLCQPRNTVTRIIKSLIEKHKLIIVNVKGKHGLKIAEFTEDYDYCINSRKWSASKQAEQTAIEVVKQLSNMSVSQGGVE